MQDYAKLKVTELKEELGKRGLPKAGLKAELVQRLNDADASAQAEDQSVKENDAESDPVQSTQTEGEPEKESPCDRVDEQLTSNGDFNGKSPGKGKSRSPDLGQDAAEPVEPGILPSKESPSTTAANEGSQKPEASDTQSTVPTGILTQPVIPPEAQLPTASQMQTQGNLSPSSIRQIATQSSLTPEEFIEDSKKRKRRSQSPPPASLPTSQKKVKSDHDSSNLDKEEEDLDRKLNGHLQDTGDSLQKSATGTKSRTSTASPERKSLSEAQSLPRESGKDTSSRTPDDDDQRETPEQSGNHDDAHVGIDATAPAPISYDLGEPSSNTKGLKSHQKDSPSGSRFKDLFTGPATTSIVTDQSNSLQDKDREIAPSVHPATSALYIREMMRPLNPKTVKDQLTALATPPETDLDPTIIKDFFLDAIRTHCFASFVSTTAASRVRSALHDRTWPNERDRRPLWVDFVPEDKIQKWIDVEQEAAGARSHMSKRWEVVYEEESGDVKAYLQEVGSGIRGLRSAPNEKKAGQRALPATAPSQTDKGTPFQRDDHSKGFQALDDLFKSTGAKPKLYYQPVPKKEADRRLDLLDGGRGGGRDDEMRRYTFENDIIVDKGPEFGMRGRGPAYRGGRGGVHESSYRGRGGGYRDEARYRGDSYRDDGGTYRRPDYH